MLGAAEDGGGGAASPCSAPAYADLWRDLWEERRRAPPANGTTWLPARVSHPLVAQAGSLVDAEEGPALASGAAFHGSGCPRGLLAALVVFARPLVHTERGQWAAKVSFNLAQRECWPTIGFEADDWPVTYQDVLEVALDAEAWQAYGPDAEYNRPPRRPMPPALVHELTPSVGSRPAVPPGRLAGVADGGLRRQARRVRVLSTGNHASYPAAMFALWRALLVDYEFELEDQSFDTRYCQIIGSCTEDRRFSWIGEHLRGTVVETCSGLFLKGFEGMASLAEDFTSMLLDGGPSSPASRADVLLCTHPPYSCRLFWPLVQRHSKPLLGFFGGTLEAHVPGADTLAWLRDFRDMAQHPRVQFAAVAPFLAEKMRYQTGVDIPTARGFGFHVISQGVTYFPRRLREVLIWKNSLECLDNQDSLDRLLAELSRQAAGARGGDHGRGGEGQGAAPATLSFRHLRALRAADDASYATLASFRAVLFVPYEVLLMTFYELYHLAVPIFLPALELGCFLFYRGPVTYPHCPQTLGGGDGLTAAPPAEAGGARPAAPYSPFNRDSVTDRLAWLEAYTDWYRFPHIQRFASFPELVEALYDADLQAISAAMRQETETALVGAAAFWDRAFQKVLGG